MPAWALLIVGAAIAVATGPRWNIPVLGWVAPVPFLLFARDACGWRRWLLMFGVITIAASLQIVTIATSPVPPIAALGYSVPLALFGFASIVISELVRRRIGEAMAIFAFASMTAVTSWIGFGFTPLGAWMSPVTSQVDQLAFLQLASLVGLGGLGFIMAWLAGIVANMLGPHTARSWTPALAFVVLVGGGLAWSAFRLDTPLTGRTVIVGAVVTELGLGEHGVPDAAILDANSDQLFERTRRAAVRGARVVVWNEVATWVRPEGERPLLDRGQAISRELGIDLVLAYAVVETDDPLLLDNKFVFISDRGEILDTYQKHHPVPGEPSIRGTGPLHVLSRPYGRVAGAICYDYDFPASAREHARAGAELVVVPSSDWRGIDPVHLLMSRVRAIEGGFSIVRPARWASSGAFDAHGRVLGWMATTQSDLVMVVTVPMGQITTLYAVVGDLPLLMAGAFLAIVVALAIKRGRPREATTAFIGSS